jgi:two-component system response regulator FixJ
MSLSPTVYVIDDDHAVRDSLRWLLGSLNLPVLSYSTGESFFEALETEPSGCIISDVRMPGMSGLDLQRQVSDNGWDIPVIIVTGHADVPMAIRAMKNGAYDFIEKPYSDQLLLERVQEAVRSDIGHRSKRDRQRETADRAATLSIREKEILDLVVAGLANREIADRLSLSIKTVEAHRSKVMAKMEATSLPHLIRQALLLES